MCMWRDQQDMLLICKIFGLVHIFKQNALVHICNLSDLMHIAYLVNSFLCHLLKCRHHVPFIWDLICNNQRNYEHIKKCHIFILNQPLDSIMFTCSENCLSLGERVLSQLWHHIICKLTKLVCKRLMQLLSAVQLTQFTFIRVFSLVRFEPAWVWALASKLGQLNQ